MRSVRPQYKGGTNEYGHKASTILDSEGSGKLKVYACPIGACPIGSTFFDELCLLMIGFDRGQRVG